jgi:trehalose 6-phosphate synthase
VVAETPISELPAELRDRVLAATAHASRRSIRREEDHYEIRAVCGDRTVEMSLALRSDGSVAEHTETFLTADVEGRASEPGSQTEPVLLVSNRGPLQYRRQDGRRVAERGAGGLVTALSQLTGQLDEATWICAALSEEDAAVAGENPTGVPLEEDRPRVRVRMVRLEDDAQEKFYGVIANPLLWFLQHSLWDLVRAPDLTVEVSEAWEAGYVAVNRRFAEEVDAELQQHSGRVTVLIHDYHFYLLGAALRERRPDVFLHHFIHIPWPQPDSWRILPPAMREAIFNGLLGCDVVAFHTERYARNFLLGCQELLGLPVDLQNLTVAVAGRTVAARWYPISVDAEALDALAASPAVAEAEATLMTGRREYLILRVDRTDPSKNIVRGFRAFDLLLARHPELAERVTFLALLQPSRQDVAEYAAYTEEIRRVAVDVNLARGTPDWQPIDLRFVADMDLAAAAYKQFDVLMVNGIFDGMNLVAKEAVLVNARDGVLALSENTGAHEELGAFAVTLHPFDIPQQADALYSALTMDPAERSARQQACAAVVRENDVAKWFRRQLDDIDDLRKTGK